jgi:hypothetical protein
MSKISFKPGNMLYPLSAVMVSVADKGGKFGYSIQKKSETHK